MAHLSSGRIAPGFWLCLMKTVEQPQREQLAGSSKATNVPLPDRPPSGDNRTSDTRKRTGRKSMSRRSGQSGSIQKDGKWYVVRYWKDVAGQEKRVRVREKICPISGAGK